MKAYTHWVMGTLAAIAACAVLAAEPVKTRFNIDSQALSSALNECARQGNREILFSPDLLQSLRTRGVHGEFSLTDALDQLLEGTNLRYRMTDADTILIEGRAAAPS